MKGKQITIDLELCKQFFYYDNLGNLYWKVNRTPKLCKNTIAGSLDKSKYIQVKLFGKLYSVHRILYQLYNNVELNENDIIDHIDENKQNNKRENLRICDRSENGMNRKVQRNNKSTGIKNIYRFFVDSYEYYYILIKKRNIKFSKLFRTDKYTLEQVIKIRDEKLKEIHGEFHNLG